MNKGDTFEYQWGHGSSDTATATVTEVYKNGSYEFEYKVYGQYKTAYSEKIK
ncbi:hypothetical protein [Flavobacterium crassostreae]|nr:hypothetical protein [Flavobacterium crassostreae]